MLSSYSNRQYQHGTSRQAAVTAARAPESLRMLVVVELHN